MVWSFEKPPGCKDTKAHQCDACISYTVQVPERQMNEERCDMWPLLLVDLNTACTCNGKWSADFTYHSVQCREPDSIASVVIVLQVELSGFRIPVWARDSSLLQNIQASAGAHSVSYFKGAGDSFSEEREG
jgi:hypothetical protein